MGGGVGWGGWWGGVGDGPQALQDDGVKKGHVRRRVQEAFGGLAAVGTIACCELGLRVLV